MDNKRNTSVQEDLDYIKDKLDILIEQVGKMQFRYYNANPEGYETDDCVIRAIAAATGDSWEEVLQKLCEYSLKYKYFISCTELYEIYLKDIGFTKHKPPRKDKRKYTLGEWLREFKEAAVVTIDNDHLVYVNNGIVYDIWDCTGHTVNEYWTYE